MITVKGVSVFVGSRIVCYIIGFIIGCDILALLPSIMNATTFAYSYVQKVRLFGIAGLLSLPSGTTAENTKAE